MTRVSGTLESGEAVSLIKRPRVGDMLETGRYGRVKVLAVHHRGVALTVKDRLNREWLIERHPDRGHWTRINTPTATAADVVQAVAGAQS